MKIIYTAGQWARIFLAINLNGYIKKKMINLNVRSLS